MAIAIGTAVWGAANSAAGNYDTSITPGSTPNGVCVIIVQAGATTDLVTSVVYGIAGGAVTLARRRLDTEPTEAGGVYIYWAGDSSTFPTGTQTVRVSRTGTTNLRAVIWTMTVAGGKQVQADNDATGQSTSVANPSWSHASLVNNVVAFLGIHSGLNTMTTTPATNWTRAVGNTTSEDVTATGRGWAERTLATAGALAPGWTAATADDFVGSSMSFKEGDPPAAAEGFRRKRGPNYRR